MDTLRVLVVSARGDLDRVTSALSRAGHAVVAVGNLEEAREALLIQRFEAVLLGSGLPAAEVIAFSANVRQLDNSSGASSRTAVLSVVPESALSTSSAGGGSGVDGFVSDSADPDTLTLAIARLASAVGTETVAKDELPVLDVDQLKEQVAFDNELLVELIDLFLSERERQSEEMQQAFQGGEFDRLSRIAHTIKGSLGSLHALAAKANAQGLELSAKEHDGAKSQAFLLALERDLNVLEGHLIAVRDSAESA
ncbi:MAG: Hpt domain-containing protein [Acidobacteriaceae bacterium]|nr:Hpt domain-containing protein [Acidobacteriaceae bacterium]